MRIAPASLALLFACTPASPTPAGPAPANAPPAPAPAAKPDDPPVILPDDTPPAQPSTDPPTEPPTSAEPPQPTIKSDFHVVAARHGDLHVFDLETELIVGGAGALAKLTGTSLERLDTLYGQLDPGYMMLASWALGSLGGRWPDPVWLQTQTHYQRTSAPPHMYYRKGDRWQRKATVVGQLHWYYDRFAALPGGKVLALRLLAPDQKIYEKYGDEIPGAVQKKLDAELARNPPRLDILTAGADPAPAPMRLAAGGIPTALATAPTGEVFLLLRFTVQKDGESYASHAVQRFAPGAADGTLDQLADIVAQPAALAVRAHDDVLVGGDGLAHYDGKAWTRVAAPKGSVTALSLGEPGVQWAIARNPEYGVGDSDEHVPETELWRQTGDGRWTRVPLPRVPADLATGPTWKFEVGNDKWVESPPDSDTRLFEPTEVLARGPGDVWVAGPARGIIGEDGMMHGRSAVVRTIKPAHTLELPDDPTLRGELLDFLPAKPWQPDVVCENAVPPWILVERLPANTAPDPNYVELLKAAIPAELHPQLAFVRESRIENHRVIGLNAEPEDAAAAKQWTEALAKFRPGVTRKFECRDPKPIRELLRSE